MGEQTPPGPRRPPHPHLRLSTALTEASLLQGKVCCTQLSLKLGKGCRMGREAVPSVQTVDTSGPPRPRPLWSPLSVQWKGPPAAPSRQPHTAPPRVCGSERDTHRDSASHVLGTRNLSLTLCHRAWASGLPRVLEFLPAGLWAGICRRKHWGGRQKLWLLLQFSKQRHDHTHSACGRELKSPHDSPRCLHLAASQQSRPPHPPADRGRGAQLGSSSSWTSRSPQRPQGNRASQANHTLVQINSCHSKPQISRVVPYGCFFLAIADRHLLPTCNRAIVPGMVPK